MSKSRKGRKLSRKSGQRKALLKALISALVLHEKIKTTEAKAREAASLAEKFISRAGKGDLASRRLLAAFFSLAIAKKLIDELGPRYKDRHGGYTRIIKLGPRKSDGAKMAVLELVK